DPHLREEGDGAGGGRHRPGDGDDGGQAVVQLGEIGGSQRPRVVTGPRVGVAVVDVTRVPAQQGTEAAGGVAAVDGVEVLGGRIGPLVAELGGGREELVVGDGDGAVDRGLDDVDIRVVRAAIVSGHRQDRFIQQAVPVLV